MLSLMMRTLFWAAWWPASTWLLTLEKATAQAGEFFQHEAEADEKKREQAAHRAEAPEDVRQAPAQAAPATPKAEEFAVTEPSVTEPTEDDMATEAFPKMEVPTQLRDLMKMGIEQARSAFENFATTSEKALKALEANPAMGGTIAELNDKIAEITRKNAEANFALAMKLAEATDFNAALAMQTQHVKTQMESFANQIEEIRDLAAKLIQEKTPGNGANPFATPTSPTMGPGGPSSPGFGGPGTVKPGEGGGSY